MDKENGEPSEEPSTKKQCLSLSLKGKTRRFASPMENTDMSKLCEGYTPDNTKKNSFFFY